MIRMVQIDADTLSVLVEHAEANAETLGELRSEAAADDGADGEAATDYETRGNQAAVAVDKARALIGGVLWEGDISGWEDPTKGRRFVRLMGGTSFDGISLVISEFPILKPFGENGGEEIEINVEVDKGRTRLLVYVPDGSEDPVIDTRFTRRGLTDGQGNEG